MLVLMDFENKSFFFLTNRHLIVPDDEFDY